jgi:PAS domain S-box-containing protein
MPGEEQAVYDDDSAALHQQLSRNDITQPADQVRTQADETMRQARAHLSQLSASLDDLARLLERTHSQVRADAVTTGVAEAAGAGNPIPPSPATLPSILADEAAYARALLDASTDELEVVDSEGRIIYLNAALTQRLGKGPEELIGTSLWDLYPPGKGSHRKLLLKRVLESGAPFQFIDRQGEGWAEITIRRLVSEPGLALMMIATRDVTKSIHTEERLKLVTLQFITSQEDERRRIAQDLHDDIGQSMTALLLNLKAIDSGIESGRKDIGHQVKDALRSVESMIKRVRQISYELRPPSLASMSLASLLEALCSSFALSSGLRVDFSSQKALPPIPDVQATAFYRLVQEGLHNTVKHAGATSVWVNLDYVDGEISVSMEDDGRGCDPAQAVGYGMGLQGIHDRFVMLDGSFDIEAAPGKGTRLYGSLPLTS